MIGDRGDRGQQQQQRGDQHGGQRSNGNPRGQDTRGPRPDRTPNPPQQQNGVPGKEFCSPFGLHLLWSLLALSLYSRVQNSTFIWICMV